LTTITKYPTLYKKTSTGKTQTWLQELDGDKYRTISGQIDGAKVTSSWTVCVGKNIGRSNETTPEQQAKSEVEANYKKKLAQGGYHDSLDAIEQTKFFKPMLAHPYEKYPLQAGEKFYLQPKFDGIRCIATKDGLFSRTGKPIPGVPHVWEVLKDWFVEHPGIVLDGELYADDFKDDFNEIVRLVRKQSDDPERRAKSKQYVRYHVYDWFEEANPGMTFSVRHLQLEDHLPQHEYLKPVKTIFSDDLGDLEKWSVQFVEDGYEGTMIRRNTTYENKRSKNLLKLKTFKDEEFIIKEIQEGVGNRSGMAGTVVYYLHGSEGDTFRSGIKGSHDSCVQLLKERDRYVGGTGTVRYFHKTPDGVPRFPVTVAFYEGTRDL
jgi:DNA ligase-1